MKFIDDGIYFVARLKSSDYKAEQKALKSNDEDVEIVLTNRKSELLQAIYDEIRVNVVPIRSDRHYHRTKGQLAANFSNTHKRSF